MHIKKPVQCHNERGRIVFALLKRFVYGMHHHMSRKYLASYCAERDFVYNGRKLTDVQRAEKAIKALRGKRLTLNGPKQAESAIESLVR